MGPKRDRSRTRYRKIAAATIAFICFISPQVAKAAGGDLIQHSGMAAH
jgi:hypothetical protein